MPERAPHPPSEVAAPPTPEAKEVLVERRDRWTLRMARSEKLSSREDPNTHEEDGLIISGEVPAGNSSQAGRLLVDVEMAPPDEVEMLARWALEDTPEVDALAKMFIDEEGQPHAVGRVRPGSSELFYATREGGSEVVAMRPLAINENGLMSEPLEEGETLVMVGGEKGEKSSALTIESADSHPETNDEVRDTIHHQEYIIQRRRSEIAEETLQEEGSKDAAESAAEEELVPEAESEEAKSTLEKGLKEETPEQRQARENLEEARDRLAEITANKMNRATGLFWTKKKEAEYKEARDAYDQAYMDAGKAGLEMLEAGNFITEGDTKGSWAALYVIEQQRALRLATNEKRLESLENSKFQKFATESVLGKLAAGAAMGIGARLGFSTLTGGTGLFVSMAAGATAGGVMGAFGGKRTGIREGVASTNIEAELADLNKQIDRRKGFEDILRDENTNLEQLITEERKHVAGSMGRGALRGAGIGAFGGAAGYGIFEAFSADTATAAGPMEASVPAESPEPAAPEIAEPRELSGDELLEMHANDAEAARDIVTNEGPYNTFQEMGIPESRWEELYRSEELMQKLIDNGDAYSLLESGDQSYGWGLSHAGELSDATIKDIYEAANMQTVESVDAGASGGAEGATSTEETITESQAEAQAEEIANEVRQSANQDIASMGLQVSGLDLQNNSDLTPAMADHIVGVEGSGFQYNSDGDLTMPGEMTPTAKEEIVSYLETQGAPFEEVGIGETVDRAIDSMTQELGADIAELDARYDTVTLDANDWSDIYEFISNNPVYERNFEVGDNSLSLKEGVSPDVVQDLVDDLVRDGHATVI